jgi:hypothetical protein
MVRHIFLWRVASGADPDEMVAILNTLPERIGNIRGWEIGRHEGDTGESGDPWDFALIADFDSFEALQQYSDDPYHVEVVEKLLPRFSARAVVDFERVETSR